MHIFALKDHFFYFIFESLLDTILDTILDPLLDPLLESLLDPLLDPPLGVQAQCRVRALHRTSTGTYLKFGFKMAC